MRILLSGVATIALSGCSWLGYTTDGYSKSSKVSPVSGSHSYHGYTQNTEAHTENRWTVSGALGSEIPTAGTAFHGAKSSGTGFINADMTDA